MAELTCNIYIEGYWRERNKNYISNYSGIFFVYETDYNFEKDTITPIRLIYIGQASNIQEKIASELTQQTWSAFISSGRELCFSTSYLTTEIERITATLVYQCQPVANTDYVDFFTYDKTTLTLSGKTALLLTHFTVQKPEAHE